MLKPKMIFLFLVIIFILKGGICAQSSDCDDTDKARILLNKMIESRSKMKNLQFNVNFVSWTNFTLVGIGQVPDEIVESTLYASYKIIMDCNGNEKREEYQYSVYQDRELKKEITTDKSFHILSWDGNRGIEYHQKDINSPGQAVIMNVMPENLEMFQPWRVYTGTAIKALQNVIDDVNYPVKVETLTDGKHQISHPYTHGTEYKSVIDPEKGYSCIKLSVFSEGVEGSCTQVEYEEFADNVWIPVKGESTGVSTDGKFKFKNTSTISNINVNDPNFTQDLFYVELPENTSIVNQMLSN